MPVTWIVNLITSKGLNFSISGITEQVSFFLILQMFAQVMNTDTPTTLLSYNNSIKERLINAKTIILLQSYFTKLITKVL